MKTFYIITIRKRSVPVTRVINAENKTKALIQYLYTMKVSRLDPVIGVYIVECKPEYWNTFDLEKLIQYNEKAVKKDA